MGVVRLMVMMQVLVVLSAMPACTQQRLRGTREHTTRPSVTEAAAGRPSPVVPHTTPQPVRKMGAGVMGQEGGTFLVTLTDFKKPTRQ